MPAGPSLGLFLHGGGGLRPRRVPPRLQPVSYRVLQAHSVTEAGISSGRHAAVRSPPSRDLPRVRWLAVTVARFPPIANMRQPAFYPLRAQTPTPSIVI